MRTQVGIIGAGPAGLLLGHLLHQAGIDSVVLEARSHAYLQSRVRAGVMEQQAADTLRAAGLGARMDREGLAHHGIVLRVAGHSHRIDLTALTGKSIMVYGQQAVVRDLIEAREAAGLPLLFGAEALSLGGLADHPVIRFSHRGAGHDLHCDIIACCDGFHGIGRTALPAEAEGYGHEFPFAWLGILADSEPAGEELVYASHDSGFALASMRGAHLSRLYLQVAPDEDLAHWSDARIWAALGQRLADRAGFTLGTGPIRQRGIARMRAHVSERMRAGRLVLAGDAAHIVPPTGAKGMNLAIADVGALAPALAEWFRHGDDAVLDAWSAAALRRAWRAVRFSCWLTTLLHRIPAQSGFERRLQRAELDRLLASPAARIEFAENYVGLPAG